jgi:DNA-binding XRE family transcriptional regulator
MPNLASFLKQEISRLCRREIRKEVGATKKASATYRRDIVALKRKVAELERKSSRLTKLAGNQAKEMPSELPDRPIRFVAKGFRAHRTRLGLSASQMGKLLDVSEQSIYNWESGHARPRKEQMVKIVALRSWGKREAHERLQELASPRK